VVAFELTREGTQIFGDYTSDHVGEFLAIVLDGVVISSPQIATGITGGSGIITGDFTFEEANNLVIQLRAGSLEVPLRVESTSNIGPSLGALSVEQSIQAGIIGISVVLLFMLVYYRLPGVAADLALIIFALLNFALFKLIPVTLTLPAITGFLISVGTAVDGNILIFERMKEELRAGKALDVAVRAGFARAWTSIRDSNLSTIIICGILFFFGSTFGAGAVRGFAVTLAIGLVINLFTAVTVTRTFLHFLLPARSEWIAERQWLLGL
jgi:protein-export membrane protein SecD